MSVNNDPFVVVYVASIYIGIPLVNIIILAAIASNLAKVVKKLERRAPRIVKFTLVVMLLLTIAVCEVLLEGTYSAQFGDRVSF